MPREKRIRKLTLPTADDLAKEIDRLQGEPSFAGYDKKVRFVLWFLLAYATNDSVAAAKSALTGAPGTKERDVDALHIDRSHDGPSVVYVVQGKYRESTLKRGESSKDVKSLAELGEVLRSSSPKAFQTYCDPKKMDQLTAGRLAEARSHLIKSPKTLLRLCYVTLFKIGPGVRQSATKTLADVPNAELVAFDGTRTLRLLESYLDGVQRVEDLEIPVADGGEAFFEHDAGGLRTWVFTADAEAIARWYGREKERIFASNVRGDEGDSRVNSDMLASLAENPRRFWHLNNGLTVTATEVEPPTADDSTFVIRGGQIVNGQQTTRALNKMLSSEANQQKLRLARVLVRVVEIPSAAPSAVPDAAIGDLAKSTNSQNKILASDLMANDRKQIWLQRELRRFNIEYVRKREGISAARAAAGVVHASAITKFHLAAAVGSTKRESLSLRVGAEPLFRTYYDEIFGSRSIYEYALPIWLLEELDSFLRGDARRDVRWVAYFFLWEQFASALRQSRGQVRETLASAKGSAALHGAIRAVVEAVWSFYWKRKRIDGKVRLPKPFFQRRTLSVPKPGQKAAKTLAKKKPQLEPRESKLYAEFERFWRAPRNRSKRKKFEAQRKAFVSSLTAQR
jgi:hypothetical protein